MKRIPINDIVTEAIEEMGLDNNMVRPLFLRWAYECSKQINGIRSVSPCAVLRTVMVDCFEIPDEAAALYPGVQLVAADFDLTAIDKTFYEMLNMPGINNIHTVSRPEGNVVFQDLSKLGSTWLHYRVDDGMCYLGNQSYDGLTVLVPFLKYRTGEDGMIRVHESESRAIRKYIEMMYARRSQFGSDERKIQVGYLDRLEDEYHRLVRLSVGKQSSDSSTYATQQQNELAMNPGYTYDPRLNDMYWPGGKKGLVLFE